MTNEIAAFLQGYALDVPDAPEIRKAGLIAYLPDNTLRYYVMTPVATKPDLGMPDFQICKGTRMYKSEAGWVDMRGEIPADAPLEPLAVTALREGMEELGVRLSNIASLAGLGDFTFTSATNRKEVRLWLLAAEMKNERDFDAPAASTAQCKWMNLTEFSKQGRPDHAHILSLAQAKLTT